MVSNRTNLKLVNHRLFTFHLGVSEPKLRFNVYITFIHTLRCIYLGYKNIPFPIMENFSVA